MTSILALETTGPVCSVCLEVDGNRFADTRHVARRHNELLLPMVRDVMARAELDPTSLDAVAFGCGPGSFTGVRIAAAATQAIALAADVPVVGVSSSEVLAQALLNAPDAPRDDSVIVTSIRSRAELHYLSAFTVSGSSVERRCSDTLCGLMPDAGWGGGVLERDLKGDLEDDLVVGVGETPAWWPDDLAFTTTIVPAADVVCELARRELDSGGGAPPESALPVYVTGDSPWVRQ